MVVTTDYVTPVTTLVYWRSERSWRRLVAEVTRYDVARTIFAIPERDHQFGEQLYCAGQPHQIRRRERFMAVTSAY